MNKAGAARAFPQQSSVNMNKLLRDANDRLNAGALKEAQSLFEQVMLVKPGEGRALLGLGMVAGRSQDFDLAIELLSELISGEPENVDALVLMAEYCHASRRFDEAVEAGRKAILAAPRDPRGHTLTARFLHQLNRVDEAHQVMTRALEVLPGDPRCNVTMSMLERGRGELENALKRIERHSRGDGGDLELLRDAQYERGFILEKLKRFEEAFAAFQEAGRLATLLPAVQAVRARPWRAHIEAFRGFSRETLSRYSAEDMDDGLPAPGFLVGFPRSGTTMTEQIMASHPDVVTIDELPLVMQMVKQVATLVRQPSRLCEKIQGLTIEQIREIRASYRSAVREAVGNDVERKIVIDKFPLNLPSVGVINAIFPEARVIVAIRDPRDVCLSCLQQNFSINEPTAQFLSLDTTVGLYEAVMSTWLELKPALTLQFIEVRYEDTVTDLESQARRILACLGVDWNENVLKFHEGARLRQISTPSFAAVTEKIHTRAAGRWRNYASQFTPFQEQLKPFVEAFGYEA